MPPISAPKVLPAFPNARRVRPKTGRGDGTRRTRWKDDGSILEWDSQHGSIERYDSRGRHRGEFDPGTGKQLKPPNPTRWVDP